MRRLTTLFPSEFPEEHAEELGVVEREGKLQLPVLVWALVFGFARSHAQLILYELGECLGYSPPPLLERLIEDAQKIQQQQRLILQETLATATQPRYES